MNSEHRGKRSFGVYVVAALGTFLIMAVLVRVMVQYTRPAPLNTARVAERYDHLKKLQAEEAKVLNEYDWQDHAKGIVRLPITNAMALIVREYQQPAAAAV